MSVRITLTDEELPPSQPFLEFLDAWLADGVFDGAAWAVYGMERPERLGRRLPPEARRELRRRIGESDAGRRCLGRVYELFVALLIGDVEAIRAVQRRFCFVLVVGAPRSGGKYLTKALFRAAGHDPTRTPAVLAHDGFPEAGPWRFDRFGASWMESLQTMAEYLAMVELFFGGAEPRDGQIVVPKKATKAVYAPGLFQSVLGASAEGVVTVRHPIAACISTYEAAGGLPSDQRFVQRCNIERLWARDLRWAGFSDHELAEMDYFEAYLRYWEDYHLRLATGGANLTRHYRVIAFGAERLMAEARRSARRFGSAAPEPETFHVRERRDRHPEWGARAQASVRRVADHWARAGMAFPADEIDEGW